MASGVPTSVLARGSVRDRQIAMAALDQLGSCRTRRSRFFTPGGGERQLVLLARALAQETPILILDEPATGLDLRNQIRMLDMISRLAHELDKAVLQTTHAPSMRWRPPMTSSC